MTVEKNSSYVATGASAKRLLMWVREEGIPEGDEIFYLAQSLSFLIHGSSASSLSKSLLVSRNRFALRKLRTAIRLLEKVFCADSK